jgi:hypothetical protein
MDKNLLLRVKALNIIIALLLIFSFSQTIISGFQSGWKIGEYKIEHSVEASFHLVSLKLVDGGLGQPIAGNQKTSGILAINEAQLTLINAPYNPYSAIANILLCSASLAVLVLLIILIWKTTTAFSRGEILTVKNIRRIRGIGLLILAKGLISVGLRLVEAHYLNHCITIPAYEITVSYWSTTLIIGLMMLVFAEVLVVANRIREEQELTI